MIMSALRPIAIAINGDRESTICIGHAYEKSDRYPAREFSSDVTVALKRRMHINGAACPAGCVTHTARGARQTGARTPRYT